VVQESIAAGLMGTAVVSGATLIKVTNGGADDSRYGTPNSSGVVVPTSTLVGNGIWLCSQRPSGSGGGVLLAILGGPAPASSQDKPQIRVAHVETTITAASYSFNSGGNLQYIEYGYGTARLANGFYIGGYQPPTAFPIREGFVDGALGIVIVHNAGPAAIPADSLIVVYNKSSISGSDSFAWWTMNSAASPAPIIDEDGEVTPDPEPPVDPP
jgi:hypothetical protein